MRATHGGRTRTRIDDGWRFRLGDHAGAADADHDDRGWRVLDLPHDWSIEATPHPDNPAGAAGGFFPGGIGWYRKRIDVPADLGDRHLLIEFDGVYMNSEVWCNGVLCGRRPYGYISFSYDLTPHVRAGEPACIAVRVDNSRQKNCRWYSGSGIYRHVWLTAAGPVRVAPWGTFVTTPEASAERALVACALTIDNETGDNGGIEVRAECLDPCGTRVAACGTLWNPAAEPALPRSSIQPDGGRPRPPALEAERPPGAWLNTEDRTRNTSLAISNPRLWSPETPHLYTLRIELKQNGRVVDAVETRFGIRSLRFDPDTGFFLNGIPTKFKGVNEHHDAGCLGAAVPDDAIRRRLLILKAMGCNAIRTAHNPASPAFLDLCDELGFLVVEDAFDEWRDGKTAYGYGQYWDDWWERDLTDMIRRDRNHPCIVLWSVGNEIKEVREGRPEGLPIMRALADACHREDPTRPMTCGCCSSRETLAAGYGPLMDVFGYNGGGGGCFDYERDHAAYPAMPMFASEHPHTLQTRGVYRTRTWYRDLARNRGNVLWHEPGCRVSGVAEASRGAAHVPRPATPAPLELMRIPDLTAEELFTTFDPHYCSSYGNAIVRMSIFDSWHRTSRLPFFCGEFRWTGFDYLGECYSWPCKSWSFGIIDLCGFPKDAYYFYQSRWTDAPMVHLLPHWTWPGMEGTAIPVIVYSNCEQVALFLDGRRIEEHPGSVLGGCRWDVPYRPGVLKAVGYRHGEAVAECVQATAGAPAAIRLCCEESSICGDGTGVAHIVVTVVDAQGRLVPNANPEVAFTVSGPGCLAGIENGDPLDTTNYKLDRRRAFHGMMLAVVKAACGSGTVAVQAAAEGLAAGECQVQVVARPADPDAAPLCENMP